VFVLTLSNATTAQNFVQLNALPPVPAKGLTHHLGRVPPAVRRGVVLQGRKDGTEIVPKQIRS